MSNILFFLVLGCGIAIGYGISRIQSINDKRMLEKIDTISRDFFNATMRQVDFTFSQNELEFDEDEFVAGVTRRTGIKIEKVTKKV